MRKKGTKNHKYSAEFKISVIMDMRANHLGYRETANYLFFCPNFGVHFTSSGAILKF